MQNNNNSVIYFDSFGVEHIPKELKAFINNKNKNITTNSFRIQAYESIMCGYFCIGFIDFTLAGKRCGKDTENINPRVSKTSNGRTMVLSKCAICDSKK